MDEFKTIPGQCYFNALNFSIKHKEEALKIVHGKVEGNGDLDGFPIIHAWVECENYVYDHDYSSNKMTKIDKYKYYLLGNIQENELVSYTLSQAAALAMDTNHCGPWDEALRLHSEHEDRSLWHVRPPEHQS